MNVNTDKQKMILLKYDGNWDLYYDPRPDWKVVHVIATDEAKKDGCKDSYFGSVQYFLSRLEKGLETEGTSLEQLTPSGRAVWQSWIKGHVPTALKRQKDFWHKAIVEGASK